MENKCNPIGFRIFIVSFLLLSTFLSSNAFAIVNNLKVEYSTNPLGIDVKTPHFSWQMATKLGERNVNQTAYQVVVKDPSGQEVWGHKKNIERQISGDRICGKCFKSCYPIFLGCNRMGRE
jgi:hypothetical protein